MVYEKSARGYTEFTNNKRTLNVRERQVLLLVNGIRNLEDLEKFFKKDHLMETLEKLETGGFIQRADQAIMTDVSFNVNAANPTPSTDFSVASLTTMSFFQTESTHATINTATLEAVKTILIEATDDYLGLMGRAIRARISDCDNESELRNCISSWHMAMRESKLGRESTSFLMQQIHQALESNTLETNAPESNTPVNNVVELGAQTNVVRLSTLEKNDVIDAALKVNATINIKSEAEEDTSWTDTARSAHVQKTSTPEPLGFLQNAFG